MREDVPNNYKFDQGRALTATRAIIPRSHLRAYEVSIEVYGLGNRSNYTHGFSTRRLLRLYRDCTAILRRFYHVITAIT